MSGKYSGDAVHFESCEDLAVHLFDRAVEPGGGGTTRLKIALLSGLFARRKWRELHTDTGHDMSDSAKDSDD